MPDLERLRQLRRVVEAAPDERFEMCGWSTRKPNCGTAYCAAGWAAVDHWFQQNTPILDIFAVTPLGSIIPRRIDPVVFLAELFGIPYRDAENLFTEGDDGDPVILLAVTKSEVLANIDRLIAGQPARCYAEAQA